MFGWLRSLFSNEAPDVYRPRERLIYRYWDGEKLVAADPLQLYIKLMAVGPELAIDMKVRMSNLKDAPKAHVKVIDKVHSIFGLKHLDAGGLTEIESVDLLDHFLTYCEGLKKNNRGSATSPTTTSPSPASTAADVSATPSGSDSGSTAAAPSTAEPGPSPTEPPSQPAA